MHEWMSQYALNDDDLSLLEVVPWCMNEYYSMHWAINDLDLLEVIPWCMNKYYYTMPGTMTSMY